MKSFLTIIILLFTISTTCFAEEKRHGPKAIEVKIEAGTKDGQCKAII